MRRSICRYIGALPFHPMALGSFAALEAVLTARSPKEGLANIPFDERVEFQSRLLLTSPKHDGIRLLVHTEPSSKTDVVKNKEARRKKGVVTTNVTTCFSRFGRPLRGLFWIENELNVLRGGTLYPQQLN
jgi:hypothetical protein